MGIKSKITASIGTFSSANPIHIEPGLIISGTITSSGIFADFVEVSSSVIFTSGSNIFGDSDLDTHEFSGSVAFHNHVTASQNLLVDNNAYVTNMVGIGTQVTPEELTVKGSVSASTSVITRTLTLGNPGQYYGITNIYDTGNNYLQLSGSGGNTFAAAMKGTSATGTLTFADFNLGIGPTAFSSLPARLTVSGDISASGTVYTPLLDLGATTLGEESFVFGGGVSGQIRASGQLTLEGDYDNSGGLAVRIWIAAGTT